MIRKILSSLLLASGAVLLLGTAGASDLDAISFSQIVYQVKISLGLLGSAGLLQIDRLFKKWRYRK